MSRDEFAVRVVADEGAGDDAPGSEMRTVRLRDVTCLRRVRTEYSRLLYASIVLPTLAVSVAVYLTAGVVTTLVAGTLTALGTGIVLLDGVGNDIAAGFVQQGSTDDYVSFLSTPSETERVRGVTVESLSEDLETADVEHYTETGTIETRFYRQSYEYLFVPQNVPELRVRDDLAVSRRWQFALLATIVSGVVSWRGASVGAVLAPAVVIGALALWMEGYSVPYEIEIGWEDDDRLSQRRKDRRFPLDGGDRETFARQLAERARATRTVLTFRE